MKYQSSSSHCSKVIYKIKVFTKWVKHQDQGHRYKNNGTLEKLLSQGITMRNIKALALTVHKLVARLNFTKMGQTPRLRSQGKK